MHERADGKLRKKQVSSPGQAVSQGLIVDATGLSEPREEVSEERRAASLDEKRGCERLKAFREISTGKEQGKGVRM